MTRAPPALKRRKTAQEFKIMQSGKFYYFCAKCGEYYAEEMFYSSCIKRQQQTCSTCYDGFKHPERRPDESGRLDPKWQLNRLRNTYKNSVGGERPPDDLTPELVQDVMKAWDFRSYFTGSTENLSLIRFDSSDAGRLEPANLILCTREEKQRWVHISIHKWAEVAPEIPKSAAADWPMYFARLRALLLARGDVENASKLPKTH